MIRRAAALCVALTLVWPFTPAAAACIASPVQDVNPQYGLRTGVAQPDASDVWISGTLAYSVSRTYPYIERYDPGGWSSTVLTTMTRSAFTAIAAMSAGQAMAVGFENGGTSALAVLFDGSGWSQTLGGAGHASVRGTLQKIAAVPGTPTAYAVLAYGAYNLLFWDGRAWAPVADALPLGGVLAVNASSRNDVWAVGGRTDRFGIVHGLVERFDGRSWTRLPTPGRLTMLTSVSALGKNGAWVTGLEQQGPSFTPFAACWNGMSWQRIALPFGKVATAVYGAIDPASPSDLWISASVPRRYGGVVTSLWHWNGHTWRYVENSEGWSATPILAESGGSVWFAAGEYRRSKRDGNRYVGFAGCGTTDT